MYLRSALRSPPHFTTGYRYFSNHFLQREVYLLGQCLKPGTLQSFILCSRNSRGFEVRDIRGPPEGASGKRPRLPAQETQEVRVPTLGRDDPLEEGAATHSSVLAWRIPQTEEPGRLQSAGLQRVRHSYRDWARTHEEPLASVMGQALCLTCCLPSN